MITKNETREPRKIHGLYRHDSGLKINYYEGDKKEFQCCNERTVQLGYGYGATPLEAIEDTIRYSARKGLSIAGEKVYTLSATGRSNV